MNIREILRKGWCPTLTRPMETGDGWLVRLPIRYGILTTNYARAIAVIARRHGNGHIDLTSRANLQIRGVMPASYENLLQDAVALDIAEEPIIPILANPLAGLDPACDAQVHAIALAIENALAAEHALPTIPAKFLCVVDGGGMLPLATIAANLHITPPFDMADITARILAKLQQGGAKIKTDLRSFMPAPGFRAFSGDSGVVGIGVPFGRMEHDALLAVAAMAERFGDGTLRLAPWRMVFIAGVTAAMAQELLAEAKAAGFITQADDPLRAIQACPGAPACQSAEGTTRALALDIAAACPDLAKKNQTVHVSGCAKGCAYAGAADIVVTARNGGYNLAFDAVAGAEPDYAAVTGEAVIDRINQRSGNV